MSSKVDEVCEKIVEYLNTHGKARWSDLLQLGFSKTTLYRALEKLLSSGIVKREGKIYILTEKDYVAIVPFYTKQICDVIECNDVDGLTRDLMRVGASVRVIERAYIEFTKTYLKFIEGLNVQKLLLNLFQSLYGHKGFFTIFLLEMGKIYKGFRIIEKCEACELFEICPPAKNEVETFINNIDKIWGIKPEVFDEVEKVGEILDKYGYEGKVKISLFGVMSMKISMMELILLATSSAVSSMVSFRNLNLLKLYEKILKIGYLYYTSGCRPLGEKEKEELIEVCKQQQSS